jgi:hypothetical protein
MAVFSRRIRTSFGPGEGTGTSSIQMPLARFALHQRLHHRHVSCARWFSRRRQLYSRGLAKTGPVTMRRTLLAASLLLCANARADEGMWMPSQLPDIAAQLRAAGFKGNPSDLADLTKAPMNAGREGGWRDRAPSSRRTAWC